MVIFRKSLSILFLCFLTIICSTAFAKNREPTELIIRFQPDSYEANNLDMLIKSVNQSQNNKINQKLANPVKARYLLSSRHGILRQVSVENEVPTSHLERLQTYIVLSYPSQKALNNAKIVLRDDQDVLWVGENSFVKLSAVPNDTLFQGDKGDGEMEYQWALNRLNMPDVWDYSRGHAYISVVDMGIEKTHPDLIANFREHLSVDHGQLDDDIDEKTPSQRYPDESPADRVGHGTHVAGILAASMNNGSGVAGICSDCSLMVGKMSVLRRNNDDFEIMPLPTPVGIVDSIVWMTGTGAQIINLSLGYDTNGENVCQTSDGNDPICPALQYADSMDVVMVAAAGNDGGNIIDYPASDYRVIGVGAVDKDDNTPPWSSSGPGLDLVAPGVRILSTMYTNEDWIVLDNPSTDPSIINPECGDSLSAQPGYGPCSGTSMATPHVSGIAAILRSVNPLLRKHHIKDLLLSKASHADNPDNLVGYGIPNPLASIKAALGSVNGAVLKNRLTPLFSLYSSEANDHFYTTAPQMAMAAFYGTLRPQPEDGEPGKKLWIPMQTRSFGRFDPVRWKPSDGSKISGYNSFPLYDWMPSVSPLASVHVFTTHNNPLDNGADLVPLYRLSYRGDYTGTNPRNIDHTYTTEQAGIELFERLGYNLDGIEGYIFPNTSPQPDGTVKLYRKYNSARDDHAIFPETELANMISQGYTQSSGNDVLGYVYLNVDSDSDGLIDGFELVIGTDQNNRDSDFDGFTDGAEINQYPYTDPLDTVPGPVFSYISSFGVQIKQ